MQDAHGFQDPVREVWLLVLKHLLLKNHGSKKWAKSNSLFSLALVNSQSLSHTIFASLLKTPDENYTLREKATRNDCIERLQSIVLVFPLRKTALTWVILDLKQTQYTGVWRITYWLQKIGKFLLLMISGKKKVKVVTWDWDFCDFSVWLNLKWSVTGPRSLRANEKFSVHCYRTELNPIYRKVVWELANRRNLISCKYPIK